MSPRVVLALLAPLCSLVAGYIFFRQLHRARCPRQRSGSWRPRIGIYIPTVQLHIASVFVLLFSGLFLIFTTQRTEWSLVAATVILVVDTLFLVPCFLALVKVKAPAALYAPGRHRTALRKRLTAFLISKTACRFAISVVAINLHCLFWFAVATYCLCMWSATPR
jgi:hypothetical protein